MAFALILHAAIWLWLGAELPPEDENARHFFGLWRTRHLLLTLASVWCAAAFLLASTSGRALARLLVSTAAVCVLWLALEALGFAGLVSYPALLPDAQEQMGMRRMPLVDVRGETHEDIASRWNLPSAPIAFAFATDRYGFRNTPDRASADVYCLGDSFLVAGLVPQPEILSAQLERRLSVPVMAVALVGISPQEEAELLFTSGLPLAGRLVIQFVFEGNDLVDSATWRARAEPQEASWKERTLLNQLIVRAQLLTQPQPAYVERRTGWIGADAYRFLYHSTAFEGLEGELEPIASTLTDTCRRVRAEGGTYAVVLIPDKLRVLGPLCRFPADSDLADWKRHCGPLPAFLASWAAREGIDFLDLTPALRAAAEAGAMPWLPADTHWSAAGHRAAADALARWPTVTQWLHARD